MRPANSSRARRVRSGLAWATWQEQVSLGHIAGLPGRLGRRKGNPDEKDKFPEACHLTRSNQKSQSS